jgi:hypothetical protein
MMMVSFKSIASVGLSVHRPEMLPIMAESIKGHETILLEDPPSQNFNRMLSGKVSIDDYLLPLDPEYPDFSRKLCLLLRDFNEAGTHIIQVEPYLETLLSIHDFFSDGHRPEELPKTSILYPVYLAERKATGALLAYYQEAMTGSFEKTIEAIITFARADAARFRLRDSMRAQALAPLIEKYRSCYIEAGVIHYQLLNLLRQLLPRSTQVKPVFLADDAVETLGENGHLYGPGDLLTLLFIFHPTLSETERHRLLAARSIIYSKIIEKEEMSGDKGMFPHVQDELTCIRTAKRLSLEDCRNLFPLIRREKTSHAKKMVVDYLAKTAS